MLHIHLFIVFSLLYSASISLCLESVSTNQNQNDPITITPLNTPQNPEKIREIINSTKSTEDLQTNEQIKNFTEEDIEEIELVFESSPKEAQCIVNHLEDPTFFPGNKDYRAAYFVGEPGSGKTTMAKAIAYKMAQKGWHCKIISSTTLLGEYRNQTAIKLQKELQTAASSNKPTIIIIDELNKLLENSDSKHHDTDTAAAALWTFLDKQNNNENFFFIGTMNRITKLPKPFKDRILFDYITFKPITDSNTKKKTFRKYLAINHISLDPEVTDDFLSKELEKIGPCSARNLKKISQTISKIQRLDEPTRKDPLVIKKISIIKALSNYTQLKKDILYDLQEETDEERQERHHIENMNLQKKHHTEQMQLQKENQNIQEKHFVQQHLLQKTIADNQQIHSGYPDKHCLSEEGKKQVDSLLSDEQKKLYENSMINTRAREAKEAAIKAAAEKAAAERAAAEKAKNRWW